MQDTTQISRRDVVELTKVSKRKLRILFEAFIHAVCFCEKLRQWRYDVVIFLMHEVCVTTWFLFADFNRNDDFLLQRVHDVSPFKTAQLAGDLIHRD